MRPLALVAVVRVAVSAVALMLALNIPHGHMATAMMFLAGLVWGLPLERLIAELIDRRRRRARAALHPAGTACLVADPCHEPACQQAHLVGVVLRTLR